MINPEITVIEHGFVLGSEYIELKAEEYGYADLKYHSTPGWLAVANLFVEAEFRNNGIGKQLLEKSREIAIDLGARSMYAALVSRESIAAFSSVFGEDAVDVRRLGTFAGSDDYPSTANAWFSLDLH